MMPLSLAGIGDENIIQRIGGSPEVRSHLSDMGFVAGGIVTVVTAIGGNLIVNVKDSRVAISREMAAKILVNVKSEGRSSVVLPQNAKTTESF